jgi:hypothetical protein
MISFMTLIVKYGQEFYLFLMREKEQGKVKLNKMSFFITIPNKNYL